MADRSVVGRDISQSVVVNGDGNTVTLTFGDSGVVLLLRRRQFRPPDRRRRRAPGEPPRELDLLVPEAGKLPLVGRQDLFSELQAWIDDEVDISVHALIGRAGTGKPASRWNSARRSTATGMPRAIGWRGSCFQQN